MDTFAERLTKLRKRAGTNQDDFASSVGVSIDTIRRWEGGKQEPRLRELLLISNILGVSLEELAGDEPENSHNKTVEKTVRSRLKRNNDNAKIIIQQGNTRVEIPATQKGYEILREKLKEVSISPETILEGTQD